jgi:hypothetical protein
VTWTRAQVNADFGIRPLLVKGLSSLLDEHGDVDELRARADHGDREAAGRLAGLLAKRGDHSSA